MKARWIIGLATFLNAAMAFAQSSGGSTSNPPPIPEPGTGWLIGLGLVGIGYSAWRRRRNGE
jgi:hypothetical protein